MQAWDPGFNPGPVALTAPARADTLLASMSSASRRDLAALRWAAAALLVALSAAAATQARAQDRESLLDLPHRARAILPAGQVQLESMYVGGPTVHGPSRLALHHLLNRLEARVPIEHLLLTASVVEGWTLLSEETGTSLAHITGSPQLGAAYRDAIGSWRYELGGATTIPIGQYDHVRRWDSGSSLVPLFPMLPLRNLFGIAPHAWGAWYASQMPSQAWSIQARARVEVDALPEVVLAGEVVSELLALQWRTAIEGAYRFDELGLIGLRAQLVVDLDRAVELVMLEPTLRVGRLEPGAGLVAHLAVPLVFWPRLDGVFPGGLWSVGVRASAGAVF